ncbi:hypothetical protein CSUI_009725 [Cystoisospora suis]|uniref:Uncharacterized protein n=1 Tax=Cystoisospora suis TaxID=483139 RepID=A0A2C6KII6_9APIC|nr:hypothetical protein CSUI_009725 [Cystoisospora suis]
MMNERDVPHPRLISRPFLSLSLCVSFSHYRNLSSIISCLHLLMCISIQSKIPTFLSLSIYLSIWEIFNLSIYLYTGSIRLLLDLLARLLGSR